MQQFESLCIVQGYPPPQIQKAEEVLDKARELIISYAGLTLQDPSMFPQPTGYVVSLGR